MVKRLQVTRLRRSMEAGVIALNKAEAQHTKKPRLFSTMIGRKMIWPTPTRSRPIEFDHKSHGCIS